MGRQNSAQQVHDHEQWQGIIQTIWTVHSDLGLNPRFVVYQNCELVKLLFFSQPHILVYENRMTLTFRFIVKITLKMI